MLTFVDANAERRKQKPPATLNQTLSIVDRDAFAGQRNGSNR